MTRTTERASYTRAEVERAVALAAEHIARFAELPTEERTRVVEAFALLETRYRLFEKIEKGTELRLRLAREEAGTAPFPRFNYE